MLERVSKSKCFFVSVDQKTNAMSDSLAYSSFCRCSGSGPDWTIWWTLTATMTEVHTYHTDLHQWTNGEVLDRWARGCCVSVTNSSRETSDKQQAKTKYILPACRTESVTHISNYWNCVWTVVYTCMTICHRSCKQFVQKRVVLNSNIE